MSRSSAARPDDSDSRWPLYAIPWLASASVHCALLIVLGLCVGASQGAARHSGPTTGISINALISAAQPAHEYYDDGPEVSMPQGDGNPSDDRSAQPVEPSATTSAQEPGGGGPLAAVLGPKPPIDFAGVLPAANPLLGSGALEGGGVGTATGATTGSQGSKNLRGGYARTGVFGVQGQGYKFVYVFDRSGSMGGHGGAPLAAAKAQLIASLQHLGQTHQFQIIFYNEHPHVFNLSGSPGRLVFGNEQNKSLAGQFIESITADGATEHEEALALALRLSPDVIFFLTDADEPRLNPRQLAHVARMNKGTSINAIEFGYGPQDGAENFLVRLARENGGKHVYVDISQLPQP